MKLKGMRTTYLACLLFTAIMPAMLAPVDEGQQSSSNSSSTTFIASFPSSAPGKPSAITADTATQTLLNKTDTQQTPGDSALPVKNGSANAAPDNTPPAEKPEATVAVQKDMETAVQDPGEANSEPPGPQNQSPAVDPTADAQKNNADQGQAAAPSPPEPRESETGSVAEKKDVAEAVAPGPSETQMVTGGNTESGGGDVKVDEPSQVPSKSEITEGIKTEEAQASQATQEAQNKANETQASGVAEGEAKDQPWQSAAPSVAIQSQSVKPPAVLQQSTPNTQETAFGEMPKPEVLEPESQAPKEPDQQAEDDTQGSDDVIDQPKEQEQNTNETQEQPEQTAPEEEAKETDILIEENIKNEEGKDKTSNDFSYLVDGSQQSSMATDLPAYEASYNNQDEETNDNREVTIKNGGEFTDDEDSHFFAYFLTIMVSAIIFYLVFHNKQRIIALIIEGRSPGDRRGRRSSSRGKYHKLDNNLEEAITATKGAKRH
ncbi:trans-Golgi network integral membrane protein 2-like isoform X2 [Penaeus japonicus]|uniref:trans-Golgi network integral membrane protein 2-like isoform X2 n=1 Tax=Penaeus japonicus TaxID=27405 RepID=UPI001C70BEF0|nr:trans-Golgi network integral membrane protein 2-like isoform X2 [Penaeus japonicus]